ncbi:hypothetical protein ACIRPK_17145 [Kitasatospora sp. NPDC101801]|uniref:hypothetical protein n=1 Tax=Kitasatospora sp. NPDC101801 TaxID=3364103 RepID=UPI0037FE6C74
MEIAPLVGIVSLAVVATTGISRQLRGAVPEVVALVTTVIDAAREIARHLRAAPDAGGANGREWHQLPLAPMTVLTVGDDVAQHAEEVSDGDDPPPSPAT